MNYFNNNKGKIMTNTRAYVTQIELLSLSQTFCIDFLVALRIAMQERINSSTTFPDNLVVVYVNTWGGVMLQVTTDIALPQQEYKFLVTTLKETLECVVYDGAGADFTCNIKMHATQYVADGPWEVAYSPDQPTVVAKIKKDGLI